MDNYRELAKPRLLLARLTDWAVVDLTDGRRHTFCSGS
jgi:hypothetical protein